MATFKKILMWICIVLFVLIAGFFGGWNYAEYRIRRNGEQSAAELKSKLELAESKLAELQNGYDTVLQLAGRQQLQTLKQQSKESQKTSQRYKELWNQTEQKINELTETNNSLIAALESNKEDTSVIEHLFGELYSDYQNLVLAKESLELNVKAQRKIKQTAYITSGAVTVTGLGLWFCGDAIDNQVMKDIGIGLALGGGIPLLSISVTDLICRFR